MRPTLAFVALATGAALPSSLRAEHEVLATGASGRGAQDARARADKLKAGLPPRLEEDVRIVGALAELFATAAAERLMNAALTLGSGARVHGRASTQARRTVIQPTLALIALATGAALCTPLLAQPAGPRPDQGSNGQRIPGSPDHRDVGSGAHRRARGARLPRSPRGQARARARRSEDAPAGKDASSSSPWARRRSAS